MPLSGSTSPFQDNPSLSKLSKNKDTETEMRKLESLHVETTKLDVVKYVSLRDIIPNTQNNNNSNNGTPNQDSPVGFGYSTNISIKNRLVKHAASAYLQSAAVLASRNQNCLTQMWQRYVEGPVGACARFVVQSVRWFVACMASPVAVGQRALSIA
ncbi:hypothetical protein QJS10_CPB22g00100 [Acorus calamus]|uniref:Uncharacterized protein n=1 Tax=Acorus calamus TaxID=4465 RepID=A0AAV9C082_ACOCL|nr:hypothetical protein QJS10_CPB22g00100 [Acorus calamus]